MRGFIKSIVIFDLCICIMLVAASIMASGVGLTGPDQAFTIPRGGSLSSYAWLWNEGGTTETFRVDVLGEVEPLVEVSPGSIVLAPGGRGMIAISYQVPPAFEAGIFQGSLRVRIQGTLSATISRNVTVTVPLAETNTLDLAAGLNLVGWLGPDCSFSEGLGNGAGPKKVWRRNPDGTYRQAEFYESVGVWWSADTTFTGLRYGEAYFIECLASCRLQVTPHDGSKDLQLSPGTNLVVWKGLQKTFDEAFPQTPDDYFVTKVWRRRPTGEYEFAQYYPSADLWWSQNPSFSHLERGGAYFVESLYDASVQC